MVTVTVTAIVVVMVPVRGRPGEWIAAHGVVAGLDPEAAAGADASGHRSVHDGLLMVLALMAMR